MHLRPLGVIIAVVVSVACLTAPSRSFAEDGKLEATPKGTIGVGLVGAELGVVIPALIGVDATWAYIVFPLAGAAGGAVLGHFLIDENDHIEVAVASLTAGMALVIPALVLALSATAYDPEDDLSSQASLGTGAVRLDEVGSLSLAAPGVAVLPNSDAGKLHVSGVSVSLLSGRF